MSKLPPFSPILTRLMGSLSNDDVSFAQLGDLIEKDTVLAGNVLRLVNSAAYARRGTISSVRHAVSILGLGKLRNVTMSMSVARMWNQERWAAGWSPSRFNLHAVAAAVLADMIAAELDTPAAEGAFAASLLQNCGMLLIAMGLSEDMPRLRARYEESSGSLVEAERGMFDTDHAALSAEMCEVWRLPAPVLEAVRGHHQCGLGGGTLTEVLHSADVAVEQRGVLAQEWHRATPGDSIDTLAAAGLGARAEAVSRAFDAEFDLLREFFA